MKKAERNEISALEAELKSAKSHELTTAVFAADEKLRAELAAAKAEIEKLRKTLEKIGEMECPYGEGGCDSDEKRGVAWQALENERKNNGHR